MAQETDEYRESTPHSRGEMRAELELVPREIGREAHILQRWPSAPTPPSRVCSK